jgi:hypothetical protein
MGLKSLVNSLVMQVKKLKDHSGKNITQEMYSKLDSKVENIIKANNLKRNK